MFILFLRFYFIEQCIQFLKHESAYFEIDQSKEIKREASSPKKSPPTKSNIVITFNDAGDEVEIDLLEERRQLILANTARQLAELDREEAEQSKKRTTSTLNRAIKQEIKTEKTERGVRKTELRAQFPARQVVWLINVSCDGKNFF